MKKNRRETSLKIHATSGELWCIAAPEVALGLISIFLNVLAHDHTSIVSHNNSQRGPCIIGFYWVLPSLVMVHWVILGFTEFYHVLPGLTRFS